MQKTAHLRQGFLLPDRNQKLIAWLKSSIEVCKSVEGSEFPVFRSHRAHLMHRSVKDNEVLLHFAGTIPGSSQATVPDEVQEQEADVGEALAPEGTDFANFELAVAIQGSLVAYAVAGYLRQNGVSQVLTKFIEKHASPMEIREQKTRPVIGLSAKINEAELKHLIESKGINKLVLNAAFDKVTAEGMQTSDWFRSLAGCMFGRDKSLSEIEEDSNMKAALTLNIGKASADLDYEALQDFTQDALDDDLFSGVAFRTKDNSLYSANKLLIKRTYSQKMNTLDYKLAWENCLSLIGENQNAEFVN